ncbi:MAG: glycerol-3-phosphate 1-O-acyltransferase PlsY [Xanthomonadales bacterium]|nr:glycerol-3-phosphate 1-O-acyltransferase PlsY [Gammaproteobacteria bacterium]NNE06683.1 glycerol-3-phosphate 1-O-acyltransferase PlsY [Xanthomonadales bacterium]NNL94395.1 glycerol-3-phosphate 1-O-acyltransferase PlsY [Xanthomonadales bacterium]
MTLAAIKILVSYMLGSLSGSLLLGRFRHVDIRTMGSGNAGGTNAFRTQGLLFALGVVFIDVAKSALAAGWVATFAWRGDMPMVANETVSLACGFAAVLGHCYPVYHGFRGGKGAATAIGALAVVQPWLLLPMFATWAVVLLFSGYVGLATVLAGFSLVPAAWYLGASWPLMVFCISLALFMTFTHRGNLARMRQGTENRFEKARIGHWFGR